jgi:hypothetical protein
MSVKSHGWSLYKQYAAQCLQQICWFEISRVSLCNETLETCNRKLHCNTVKFTVFLNPVFRTNRCLWLWINTSMLHSFCVSYTCLAHSHHRNKTLALFRFLLAGLVANICRVKRLKTMLLLPSLLILIRTHELKYFQQSSYKIIH